MLTQDMISYLYGEIGTAEFPPGSNVVKYNQTADREMWAGYHPRVGQPWCGTFIDDFMQVFGIDYPGKEFGGHFYTPSSMGYYERASRLLGPNASNTTGCPVFFKWDKGQKNADGNRCHHVGFVTNWFGSTFETVEGNINDQVVRLVRDYKYVVGFGVPIYPASQAPDSSLLGEIDYYFRNVVSYPKHALGMGDTGDEVKAIQWVLNALGWHKGVNGQVIPIDADGIFGEQTEAAVKTFQRVAFKYASGRVGPKTWTALGLKKP
jgi:Putative peptidoglycan binding domain